MKERRPSREERHQREKEELSRQKLQEQAFLETQRNVFARIRRGEDDWGREPMESWELPPMDWDAPPEMPPYRPREDTPPYRGRQETPAGWNTHGERTDTPVIRYDSEDTRRSPYRPPDDFEDARRSPYRPPDDFDDTRRSPRRYPEDFEEIRRPPLLNPAIMDLRWDSPEEREKPKRGKRKILVTILLALALLLAGLAVVHQMLVRTPELPSTAEEGIPPVLLEAGRKPGVYTFLLVGRDDGGGGNTDTIMVGCFDTENGTADVLSIFRDTLVDVPWDIKKINSVYNVQGIDGLKAQVRNLIGYTPDYYFIVEMGALAEIVDTIGGVDYAVPYNMDYDDPTQDLHIHFQQGMQHLNGEDAVKVLRWRKNNSGDALSIGDVGRVEIQHDFLRAMADQALSLGNLTKIRQLARIVDENLESDLSYGEMFWFGEQAIGMRKDGIRFHSLPGDYSGTMWSQTYHNYQSYVFVNDSELLGIVNQFMNPYQQDIPPESQHVLNGTTVSSHTVLP